MPQIFQVLRCYKCAIFQVHQTKKSNKFECKLCGEKQSIKRHYGIGIAKDCRLHVQKLNGMRGDIDELKCGQMTRNVKSEGSEDEELETKEIPQIVNTKQVNNSKWSDYVEDPEPIEDNTNEPMCLGDAEVVLELPKKRRKQFSNYCKSNNVNKPVEPILPTGPTRIHNTPIINKFKPPYNKSQEFNVSSHQNVDSFETADVDISIKKYQPYSDVAIEDIPTEILNKENSKPNVPSKKFGPPVIDKKSKWAGFVEEEEIEEPLTSPEISQNDQIFALCDDSELDSVLDI